MLSMLLPDFSKQQKDLYVKIKYMNHQYQGGIYLFNHKNSAGVDFYLHSKDVKLRGGRMQKIFYFSKDSSGSIEMPSGYIIIENKRTRLPLLKKK